MAKMSIAEQLAMLAQNNPDSGLASMVGDYEKKKEEQEAEERRREELKRSYGEHLLSLASGEGHFINPYTFFPLGGEVAKKPRPKEPCYKGATGYLECSLSIDEHSALLVPNTTKTFFDEAVPDHKVMEFNSDEDLSNMAHLPKSGPAAPVIPGSELRGMVRSVYEQLTNSCMLEIDEDNLPNMRTNKPKDAYRLAYDGQREQWGLYQAQLVYLEPGKTRLDGKVYNGNVRPQLNCKRFCIDKLRPGTAYVVEAHSFREGDDPSDAYILHVTGEMDKKKTALFKEDTPFVKTIDLKSAEQDTMQRFLRVIDDYCDDSWTHENHCKATTAYQEYRNTFAGMRRRAAGIDTQAEPDVVDTLLVYADNSLTYLSPACITREYFVNTVSSLARTQGGHESCNNSDLFCPACQLFGGIGETVSRGSKLRFTDARYQGRAGADCYEMRTLAPLSTPKISAFEFYLKRPDSAAVWNYDYFVKSGDRKAQIRHSYTARLQGRKVYWHFQREKRDWPEKSIQNISARLLKKGTFTFKVFFEELTQGELARLVFSVGGLDGRLQKLGHGKPLGLGSVIVKVDKIELQKRSLAADGAIVTEIVDGSRSLNNALVPSEEAKLIEFLATPLWSVKQADVLSGGKPCGPGETLGDLVSYPKRAKGPISKDNATFSWFKANRGSINVPDAKEELGVCQLGD